MIIIIENVELLYMEEKTDMELQAIQSFGETVVKAQLPMNLPFICGACRSSCSSDVKE